MRGPRRAALFIYVIIILSSEKTGPETLHEVKKWD
jgi:hypothetical protein